MSAREVKDRLRRRYPASGAPMPGPWTVLEEYAGIDLLAFCAWNHAAPARRCDGSPVIGHEVKVSRSDYRRELLRPGKRSRSVRRCTEFYFVTPAGLLTDEEKAYIEPEHFEGQAFERERCPAKCHRPDRWERRRGLRLSGHHIESPIAYGDTYCSLSSWERKQSGNDEGREVPDYMRRRTHLVWKVCETCEGRGYLRKSVVETEAPTLWIPRDVGLIEVSGRGCSVGRKSPINHQPLGNWGVGQLVRWVSMRPDPRHHERLAREAVAA